MPEAEAIEIDSRERAAIDGAWARVEASLAELPEPLAQAATDFLARRRPQGSHRDYFSDLSAAPLLYLPLWLRRGQQRAGHWSDEGDEAWTHALLEASMWGYFYIRIQDDRLDEREVAGADDLLGNLFVSRMVQGLSRLTDHDPAFVALFDRAWLEFSRQTLAEQTQLRSDEPYPRESFERHADKVAFARVPMLAVCHRAGRLGLAPRVEGLVHSLGVACGLLNDLRGFGRDLANGHRTYLLARAGWTRSEGAGEVTEALRQRLYEGGLLAAMEEEAREAFETALTIAPALGIEPELRRYCSRVYGAIDAVAQQRLALSMVRALQRSG